MLYMVRSVIRKLPGIVIKAVPLPAPEVISGAGTRKQAGALCRKNGVKRALIVTDQTLFSLGLHEKVVASLTEQGVCCSVFSDISSEPNLAIIDSGRKALNDFQADAVVALGGGAVMDSCKMIAAGGRLKKRKSKALLYKILIVPKKTLPIIAIPTTAGTGAEITVGAVVTNGKSQKKCFVIAGLNVKSVILDSELTQKAPKSITCACGIDALSHGLEGVAADVRSSGDDLRKSMECVRLTLENLPILIREPDRLEARQNMCLAALYGGNAINKQLAGYVHAFAHSIGAKYHLSHGNAIALSLLPVMRFQKKTCLHNLAELSRYCKLALPSDDDEAAADRLLNEIQKLIDLCAFQGEKLRIPRKDYKSIARAVSLDSINYSPPIVLKNRHIYTILDEISR